MDLTEFWQRHRPFLIAIAGALVLFLVGRTIISSIWGLDELERRRNRSTSTLARENPVPTGQVRVLSAQVQAYQQRVSDLADRLAYRLSDEFVLPPGGNPQSHYIDVMDRNLRTLVYEPARRDILVPKDLGLPDMPSAERDEVQRTLRALNVIQQVVTYAVAAQVNAIDDIEFKVRQRRSAVARAALVRPLEVTFEMHGTGRTIARFLEILATQPWRAEDSFLAVLPGTRIEALDETGERIKATIRVAALAIDREQAFGAVES